MPLVSIVIPTYNRAHLVGDAIRSALAQTHTPCEVIVVDDGSVDETQAVVQAFGDAVTYIRKSNGGVESAMNTGADHASGTYLCFLGDDDRMRPQAIEWLLAPLEHHPEAGLSYGQAELIDGHGRRVMQLGPSYARQAGVQSGSREVEHLLLGNYITGSVTLMRRTAWNAAGGFDPTWHSMCEDWDLWVRIASRWAVAFTPKIVQSASITPGSLLSKIEGEKRLLLLSNHRRLIDRVFADPHVGPELARRRSRIEAGWLVQASTLAYLADDIQSARMSLVKAYRAYPGLLMDREIAGARKLALKLALPASTIRALRSRRARSRQKVAQARQEPAAIASSPSAESTAPRL